MPTDNDTIQKSQAQLNRCAMELAKIANDVADAKAVREFSSDRLKRAFSVEVSRFLKQDHSGVAAEHLARSSDQYGSAIHDLEEQYKSAMRVIERHDALKVMFESARSILSTEKAKIGLL